MTRALMVYRRLAALLAGHRPEGRVLLKAVCDEATRGDGYRGAACVAIGGARAATGLGSDEVPACLASLLERCARTGRSKHMNDFGALRGDDPLRALVAEARVRSIVLLPIKAGGETLGAVALLSTLRDEFTASEREHLGEGVELLGRALAAGRGGEDADAPTWVGAMGAALDRAGCYFAAYSARGELWAINETLQRATGHDPARVQRFEETLSNVSMDFRLIVTKGFERVLTTGESITEVIPERGPDGVTRRVLWRGTGIRSGGAVVGMMAIGLDVTGLLGDPESLPEGERLFRYLAETASDVIASVRIHPEFQILYISPSAIRIHGYSAEEVMADPALVMGAIHPDSFGTARAIMEDRIDYAKPQRIRWVHRDGREVWTEEVYTPIRDETGRLVGTTSIGRDITDRVLAERALHAAEAKLALALRASDLGTWEFQSDSGRLVFDERFRKLLGVPPGEALPDVVEFQSRLHPDDRERVNAAHLPCIEDRERLFEVEYRYLLPSGEWRWLAGLGGITEFDGTGAPLRINGVTMNIDERKRADQRLRESEERFRGVFENSPMPMWVYVYDDLGIIEVNAAALRQYGYTRERFLSMTILDIRPPEERERVSASVLGSRGSGLTHTGPWNHRRADGTLIEVEIMSDDIVLHGRPARIVCVQDITDRLRAERAVRRQLERTSLLNKIARSVAERSDPASLFPAVLDLLREQLPLRIAAWISFSQDRAALTLAHVSGEPPTGPGTGGTTPGTRVAVADSGLATCIETCSVTELRTGLQEAPLLRALHESGIEHLLVAPVAIGAEMQGAILAGREVGGAFTTGDTQFLRQVAEHVALALNQALLLDEVRAAYDEVRRTAAMALAHERMHAMGQMASGIAHDINNALLPITMYTDLILEQEAGLSAEAKENLAQIRAAGGDISKTVARLGDVYRTRPKGLRAAEVDLNALAGRVLEISRPRWRDMAQRQGVVIETRLELASPSPVVRGDEGELRDALVNLVFNAADAMPQGGTIVIATGQDEGHARIAVSDSGHGMTEDTRRRCIEPFFTTKGERGTGLGLAMVYGAVRRHGGALQIESRLGVGTTVEMRMPIDSGASSPEEGVSAMPTAAPRGLRVLAVDDEEFARRALSAAFAADGHEAVTASGGQEALDIIARELAEGRRFDLLVTDLGMPRMEGTDFAQRARRLLPDTPIIMLTGWSTRAEAQAAVQGGIDLVLGKPLTVRGLREALARIARGRRQPPG